MFFDITKNMMLGGVLGAAGGESLVGPSLSLVVWTLVVLVLIGAAIVLSRGGSGRRFLGLARAGTTVALGMIALSVAISVWGFASGSDSVSTGGPVFLYGDHVELEVDTGARSGPSDAERLFVREGYGEEALARSQSTLATVTIEDPSLGQWAIAMLPQLAGIMSLLLLLIPLHTLLGDALRGRVFLSANARRLRLMALAVVLLGPIGQVIEHRSMLALLHGLELKGGALTHYSFSSLGFAVLLLALAEVWRRGIALQRESEATV
jgi:hypothetical protein